MGVCARVYVYVWICAWVMEHLWTHRGKRSLTDNNRQAMVDAGAVPNLIAICKLSEKESLQWAVWAVAALAQEGTLRGRSAQWHGCSSRLLVLTLLSLLWSSLSSGGRSVSAGVDQQRRTRDVQSGHQHEHGRGTALLLRGRHRKSLQRRYHRCGLT